MGVVIEICIKIPRGSDSKQGDWHISTYNRARRLRLEKLLCIELFTVEVPTDILNRFWIQVAVSLLKPPYSAMYGGFRIETAVT
jgi:hypothetical protein